MQTERFMYACSGLHFVKLTQTVVNYPFRHTGDGVLKVVVEGEVMMLP